MKHLGFLTLTAVTLSSIAISRGVKDVYVVVTPGGPLTCKIKAVDSPPKVDNDLIHFRVTVKGGTGPYEWRLPLYKTTNGYNDVAIARIGKVSLNDDSTFPLDLNVTDLEKTDRDPLIMTLRSQERFEGTCALPSTALKQLAKAVPPKKLIIEGGVIR